MNLQTKKKFEPAARLIKHFGGQVATAKALNVEQGTVSGWLNFAHGVSSLNAMRAEKLTSGAIKADELCPELAQINEQLEEA